MEWCEWVRLSARTGIRAVDVGLPLLAMHSVREMMGSRDLTMGYHLFRRFLRDFRAIDQGLFASRKEP